MGDIVKRREAGRTVYYYEGEQAESAGAPLRLGTAEEMRDLASGSAETPDAQNCAAQDFLFGDVVLFYDFGMRLGIPDVLNGAGPGEPMGTCLFLAAIQSVTRGTGRLPEWYEKTVLPGICAFRITARQLSALSRLSWETCLSIADAYAVFIGEKCGSRERQAFRTAAREAEKTSEEEFLGWNEMPAKRPCQILAAALGKSMGRLACRELKARGISCNLRQLLRSMEPVRLVKLSWEGKWHAETVESFIRGDERAEAVEQVLHLQRRYREGTLGTPLPEV